MGIYKKIAAVFPGQGSQYIGMGKDLYEKYNVAKEVFEKASNILKINVTDLIFNSSKEELVKTENAQIAVFIVSMAAYKVFETELKIKPCMVAGHSLGELTALTASGALSFEDALLLVHDRSNYMKEACNNGNGVMYAIRNVMLSHVMDLCQSEENVWISNINTKNQIVISGEEKNVRTLAEQLSTEGAIINKLNVSGAFHSGLMKPVFEKMKKRVKSINIEEPIIPVFSNVNACFEGKNEISDNLCRQIVMPVLWEQIIERFVELGVQAVVEFGAGHILSNMVKSDCSGTIDTFKFENSEDVKIAMSEINSFYEEIKTNIFEKCLAISVCVKNNNYNNEEYENNVVKNIDYLRKMSNKENISADDKLNAAEVLEKILQYKKVPDNIIDEKIVEIKKYF